ncbi:MAG: ABC transporter substrate-binding protein [Dehalococcoidia bacterium]|nr:ABC transporter substrate-binding protein [Dehalococcoidia bacterium]
MRVAIANDAQSGDGAITGGGSWPVTAYVYDPMLARSRITGQFVPALAESWTATDGAGKIWEYKLRQGVKFHNGQPLTSDDVVYTYERLQDPDLKATRAGQVKQSVEKVEAVDPLTVRFTLTKPDVTWPAISSAEFLIPREYASQVGLQKFADQPIGTGPFKLIKREVNNVIEYEANRDYWNSDPGLGVPVIPRVDKAILRILPESETRISALLAGEVDVIVNVPSTAINRLKGTSGVQLINEDTGQPLGILINSQAEQSPGGGKNPYRDVRVRQALNYAINLDEIIDKVLTGTEIPNTGVNRAGLGATNDIQPYPFDPQKARALLDEAGYSNGIKGDDAIIFNPGNRWAQSRDVCDAIAGYLRQVGIEATVRDLEYATAATELNQKKLYPMAFWGQHPSPESINQIEYFFVAPGIRGLYQGNSAIDTLVAQARTAIDESARGKLYGQIQKLFFEDAGHIFLYSAVYTFATRGGWTWTPAIPTSGEIPLWGLDKA